MACIRRSFPQPNVLRLTFCLRPGHEPAPLALHIDLNAFDLILGEPAVALLDLEVSSHRNTFGSVVNSVAVSTLYLVEQEGAGLHRKSGHPYRSVVGHAPTGEARGQDQ